MGKENLEQGVNVTKRDYNRIGDAREGMHRLINSFAEDKKAEASIFKIMNLLLIEEPELTMSIIQGSIEAAKEKLGQDRSSGSSATLFYPIETATKLIALKKGVLPEPLSAKSWDVSVLTTMFRLYPKEIVDLAGSNTTSLNLPQRAGHILWMIDQIESIPELQNFIFLEIGASAGLILDGLKNPSRFMDWMKTQGYTVNYGSKTNSTENAVMGLDLVIPTEDWARAVIPGDNLREEVENFMSKFYRSKIIQGDATELDSNIDVINHFKDNSGIAFIYSCSAFYQIPENVRNRIRLSVRTLLDRCGGGYFMLTDFASNMGFPDIPVGSVSWVENHKTEIVSPKILTSGQTLTNWTVILDSDKRQ